MEFLLVFLCIGIFLLGGWILVNLLTIIDIVICHYTENESFFERFIDVFDEQENLNRQMIGGTRIAFDLCLVIYFLPAFWVNEKITGTKD